MRLRGLVMGALFYTVLAFASIGVGMVIGFVLAALCAAASHGDRIQRGSK